jgi:FdhD protein
MAARPDPGAARDAPADHADAQAGTRECVEWRYRDGRLDAALTPLAVEVPIALEFNGIAHAVMLATPADLEDFALGFSLSEGILAGAADLYGVEVRPGAGGITVELRIASGAFAGLKDRRRTLAGRTGCGICGTESLEQVLRPLRAVADPGWRLASAALARAGAALGDAQPLQRRSGASHAAAWCALDGSIVHVREDVGRHNALDKLVGALVRNGVSTREGFALITSRASVEMVQKAATAGIALLAAVSGPTTLAVQTAEVLGVTLIGFTRGDRFSVYTHRARVDTGPGGT